MRLSDTTALSVGPDSVAYRLDTEALCFGGETLTATDIVVASRAAHIGTTPVRLEAKVISAAQAKIRSMIERAIDTMKTSSANVPVYLVGGGAALIPDDLRGVSKVHRFPFSDAANAVGAACAQVAGSVDTYEDTTTRAIAEVQKDVEDRAIQRAVAGGADPARTVVVESECIPIACECCEHPELRAHMMTLLTQRGGPDFASRLRDRGQASVSETPRATDIARRMGHRLAMAPTKSWT